MSVTCQGWPYVNPMLNDAVSNLGRGTGYTGAQAHGSAGRRLTAPAARRAVMVSMHGVRHGGDLVFPTMSREGFEG